MRKWLAILAAMTMTVSGVGCAGANTTQPAAEAKAEVKTEAAPSKEESKPAEKQKIKFAVQADSTPALEALISTFNGAQDQYSVEVVEFTNDSGQMHDQLITSLSSGSSEYDVMSLDVVWAGEFAGAGYIEALDMLMDEAGLKIEDFNAGSMASGSYQGKQYTMPYFPDLGFLYYRSDIVSAEDAAKLDSGAYTYDDLYEMAAKYKGQNGTEVGYVFQSKQYEGLTCNVAEFTGGYTNVKAGLEAMKKIVSSDVVPKDILNYDEGATHTSFTEGKSVFARNWPYQYGIIKGDESKVKPDQVGIAPLPNGDVVGGWLLSMNKKSANKEGAWEFIKFVAGEEGQKINSTKGGYLPGVNELLNNEEIKAANELLKFPGFQKALQSTVARPVSAEYAKASDAVQVNVHKFLSGSQDLDTTVAAVEAALK
ncbi:extracellular solute-binding protein [Cellulosilyticum sp. I15G10I2]|uniref:extracellular solute-binding protein n=1 Tax=Cellulosilyticum sp. I15G10I2 TaxID=1892843 RepID=UPI00085BDBF0|nr:extracellular solute-binding protein [Cellulosilyticum sp. I15G10I2]